MKGLINILCTIIFFSCLIGCRAHMSTHMSEHVSSADSFVCINSLKTVSSIDRMAAYRILCDANSHEWIKILVYDTEKPDHPLVMDIEKNAENIIRNDIHGNDSSKFRNETVAEADITNIHVSDKDLERDRETEAEERASDIGLVIVKMGFLLLILYGLYVLSKMIR